MKIFGKIIPILILSLLSSLLLLAGCGNENIPPDGSTIYVGPDHSQAGIAADRPVNFTVVARYPDGTPMPKAIIKISGAFAVPRPFSHYQFYRSPDALSGTEVDSGFLVQTGDDGSYMFSALISFANGEFSDTIVATSGTTIGTALIEVTL